MNFRHLDLNLLRVLCAVHRTGSVTAAEMLEVQPFASVTVAVYVPAARPVAVAPVWLLLHR